MMFNFGIKVYLIILIIPNLPFFFQKIVKWLQ